MWNWSLEGRTLKDICKVLNAKLKDIGLEAEGVGVCDWNGIGDVFPAEARWVACYPVLGDSEGHYIHIDAIIQGKGRDEHTRSVMLFLGKTFEGFDRAAAIAKARAAFFQERWWEPIVFPGDNAEELERESRAALGLEPGDEIVAGYARSLRLKKKDTEIERGSHKGLAVGESERSE